MKGILFFAFTCLQAVSSDTLGSAAAAIVGGVRQVFGTIGEAYLSINTRCVHGMSLPKSTRKS